MPPFPCIDTNDPVAYKLRLHTTKLQQIHFKINIMHYALRSLLSNKEMLLIRIFVTFQ